ncbi:MAG: LPS assembly lipoprotein LptE [Desulfosudaceae bacterium]
MPRKWTVRLWLAGILLICLAGCGYRFAGSGGFPGEVSRVFIRMFDNRTADTSAENVITNSLVNEFTRRGGVQVTDAAASEAVLSGSVRSISTATVTHASQYTTAERRLVLRVDARLTSRDGEVLWAAENLKEDVVYPVAGEDSATTQTRRAALSRAAEDMARSIYNRLTANF